MVGNCVLPFLGRRDLRAAVLAVGFAPVDALFEVGNVFFPSTAVGGKIRRRDKADRVASRVGRPIRARVAVHRYAQTPSTHAHSPRQNEPGKHGSASVDSWPSPAGLNEQRHFAHVHHERRDELAICCTAEGGIMPHEANLLYRMSEQESRCAVARWARAIGLATVVLFPSATAPVGAQTEPAPTCKTEWETIKGWLPAGARIVLLVAASNTIPANLWPRYKEYATSILACAGDGTVIEVVPITDSGAGISPLLVATAPTPGPNQLRSRLERDAFVKHGVAAIESLYTTSDTFTGFDPLGTLQLAGDSLHHGTWPGKLIVVMIGNGWQQTERINLFRWRDNPANHAEDRKSTRLNSSHANISYAVFCLKKKKQPPNINLYEIHPHAYRKTG